MNIAQLIFKDIQSYLVAYNATIYEALMQSYGTAFKLGFVIYTIYVGYCLWTKKEKGTQEILFSYAYIAIFYTFMLEYGFYRDAVIKPILGLTGDLSTFFISVVDKDSFLAANQSIGSTYDVFQQLDNALSLFINTCKKIMPTGNLITNAHLYVESLIGIFLVIIVFGAMYVAFFAIYTMAYFSLFICFVIGGPCLLCFGFKETRHITVAWIRAVANYSLLAIFASITIGISLTGIITAIDKMASMDSSLGIFTEPYFGVIVWSVVTLAMILKSPDFAAALTGSSAGSTSGIAGAISAVGGAAGGAVFGGSKWVASRTAGRAASWAGRKTLSGMKNLASTAGERLRAARGIKND